MSPRARPASPAAGPGLLPGVRVGSAGAPRAGAPSPPLDGRKGVRLPRIFHVNWFRRDEAGRFLWPGFGENARVLDWICRRLDGEDSARETPIGLVPKEGALDLSSLGAIDTTQLFSLPKDFWQQEVHDIRSYLTEQVNQDLPKEVLAELEALEGRVRRM